jgi:hypothetical protein
MTTYTWDERVAILKSVESVPYTEEALVAAIAKLESLATQYPADPDILGVGEGLNMDLSGLRWQREQDALASVGATGPRRGP